MKFSNLKLTGHMLWVGLLALPMVAWPSTAPHAARTNLVVEGIPAIPERIQQRLGQYQRSRSARFLGWHPSGKGVLIATRFDETSQIHWVQTPGGARRQVTFFSEPIRNAQVSPHSANEGFLFAKDSGGSEFFQLYYFDLETGDHRMLSDGSSRNGSPIWAPDGMRYAYHSTRRNGRDWDIYLGSLDKPGQDQPVLEKGGSWVLGEWSPDGRRLLATRLISANENHPHIFDLESRQLTALAPGGETISYGAASFAPDGGGLFFTSDQNSLYKRLHYLDFTSGNVETLSSDVGWDVEALAVSPDGRYLAFSINEDGVSRLLVKQTADWTDVQTPDIPIGIVRRLEFSPDGRRLGFQLGTPRSPGDVFALDLEASRLERWTLSEIGGLRNERFVEPTRIQYPTFDQVDGKPRMIPAFYYRPAGKGPFPTLIQIHGGPEGQSRPSFDALRQYLVNEMGIAVLTPNVRGSTGYGKEYVRLDNGMLREDSVKDIGSLLDWIAEQPELDTERVAVAGGSYGGYMTLASMVHFNDRLRAGIDVVGISNFVTFLENTKDYRRDLRRVEYGDERDEAMRRHLEAISPANRATHITKPLLIAQGLNDPRVPASESEQMVDVIRKNGGEVWYLVAKDEGHGFRKKGNRDFYQQVFVLFLERFLMS